MSTKFIKTFEQFSINEEETTRSNGYVPGFLKKEFENNPENTKIFIDALSYTQSATDDLVICFVESNEDDLLRIPKSKLELEKGEGI
jgi:hypothetical protein|tara:strand:- start:256 stop:516 length:261 start_codon:yes stop_codon:yes gene_type:complete